MKGINIEIFEDNRLNNALNFNFGQILQNKINIKH